MSVALAKAAKLPAEPARAIILVKLMDGSAVPAGELSWVGHVSSLTKNELLAGLINARCVVVCRQGRHRYYELANQEVACVVESLLILSSAQREARLKTASEIDQLVGNYVAGSLQYDIRRDGGRLLGAQPGHHEVEPKAETRDVHIVSGRPRLRKVFSGDVHRNVVGFSDLLENRDWMWFRTK